MAPVTEERGHGGPLATSVPRLDVQSLVASNPMSQWRP